jgi:hypothetical protein
LKVLERQLNELSSGKKYEVINFAVPGYNTAIEVEVFKQECLRYDPDLVIMHFNTNDYDVPGFMNRLKIMQRYVSPIYSNSSMSVIKCCKEFRT